MTIGVSLAANVRFSLGPQMSGRKCPKVALKKRAANVRTAKVRPHLSGRRCPISSRPQMSGPQMSGPQMSGPQMSGPQMSGPQMSYNQTKPQKNN
ncbi:hypothetical protein niasHT_013745 [Heterodera trifolii]|uniref:Uncharacterized protein n=1 Tax=Heterodera trifolii TaxID=157864 RepID=A0ABD2LBX2_9BILA